MNRIITAAIILTAAASLSFADEGEQSKAQPERQAESQIATQARVQPKVEPKMQFQVKPKVRPEPQKTADRVIKDATLRTGVPDSVQGKVESVTPSDSLTRPRSSMVITDSTGKTVNFIVKALAVVYDSTGHIFTLNNIKPSDEVKVNYITKADRSKEASSIKVLKQE